jgi:hypothetical protein
MTLSLHTHNVDHNFINTLTLVSGFESFSGAQLKTSVPLVSAFPTHLSKSDWAACTDGFPIEHSTVSFAAAQKNYYGTHIGRLAEYHHAVSGDVFAVDSRTLFIKSFNYDGEGPAAYFYVGNSKTPSNQGGFRWEEWSAAAQHRQLTPSLPRLY